MGGRFGDHRALMAAFGGPLPKDHIPPAPLAADSPGASYLEKEAPQQAAFGEACGCETVGFPGRLREKPAVKPDGRRHVLLECSFSIP